MALREVADYIGAVDNLSKREDGEVVCNPNATTQDVADSKSVKHEMEVDSAGKGNTKDSKGVGDKDTTEEVAKDSTKNEMEVDTTGEENTNNFPVEKVDGPETVQEMSGDQAGQKREADVVEGTPSKKPRLESELEQ